MPKDFSIKPYVQLQTGAFQYQTPKISSSISINTGNQVFRQDVENPAEYQTINTTGLTIGTTAKKGNAFADASVTFGNKFRAYVKAGYEINLGKEFGLDLTAHAQHNANMPQIAKEEIIYVNNNLPDGIDIICQNQTRAVSVNNNFHASVQEEDNSITNYKAYDKFDERYSSVSFAGLGTSVQYKPSWGTVGVGVEAGIKNTRSYVERRSYNSENNRPGTSSEYYTNNNSVYVTPTLNAKVNLGKGFSLNADAQLREANIGVRKTF